MKSKKYNHCYSIKDLSCKDSISFGISACQNRLLEVAKYLAMVLFVLSGTANFLWGNDLNKNGVFSTPYFEGFDGEEMPEDWTTVQLELDNSNSWEHTTDKFLNTFDPFGNGMVTYYSYESGESDAWLISPQIQLKQGGDFYLNFYQAYYVESSSFKIKFSVSGNNPEDFYGNILYELEGPEFQDWNFLEIHLNSNPFLSSLIENGIVDFYIAFVCQSEVYWAIDEFQIKESPAQLSMQPPSGEGTVSWSTLTETEPAVAEIGEELFLRASPATGYTFSHWDINGDISTRARDTVVVDQDLTIQAYFEPYGLDELWRQHNDNIEGDYDFASVEKASNTFKNETLNIEVVDFFSNSYIDKIHAVVFYVIAINPTWTTWEIESQTIDDLTVRFFSGDYDNPAWNDPIETQIVDAKVYDTGEVLTSSEFGGVPANIYKLELNLEIPVEIQEGWIALRNPYQDRIFILEARRGNNSLNQRSYLKQFANTNVLERDYNLMFELWGEKQRITHSWVGGTSVDWHIASNWDSGVMPGPEDIVVIGNGTPYQPTISSNETAVAWDVHIETDGTLTLADLAQLHIYGDLTVEGALWAYHNPGNNPSTVTLKGVQSQINSPSLLSFSNLTLEGSGVSLHTSVEVYGVLDLADAVITFDAALVDEEDEDDYIHIREGGSIAFAGGWIAGTIRHDLPQGTNVSMNLPVGTQHDPRWIIMENINAVEVQATLSARFLDFSLNDQEDPLEKYSPFDDADDFYGETIALGGVHEDDTDEIPVLVNTLSEAGVWQLSIDETASNLPYDIRFSTHGIAGIQQADALRMLKRSLEQSDNDWKITGVHGGVTDIAAAESAWWISRTGVSGFSYWALGSSYDSNPLPIELYDFGANCRGDQVQVYWQTASEINNSHFVLERAGEDGHFETVARVEGAGNSNSLLHYEVADRPERGGVVYYRLTQYDFDGQYETFAPIVLQCQPKETHSQVRVYPNPATDHLIVELHTSQSLTAQAELYNMNGMQVYRRTLTLPYGHTQHTLDIHHLPRGMYLLRILTEDAVLDVVRVVVR